MGITVDTYSHVLPTMQWAAANRMDGILKRAAEKGQQGQVNTAAGA